MASTRKGFWISGRFPFSSSMPALAPTPRTVPSVEKKSPQKETKISGTAEKESTSLKSKANIRLPRPLKSGTLASVSGTVVTPRGIPRRVTATIPMRIAPVTLRAVSTAISTRPKMAR